jgi:CRISPR-associated protein Cas2
MIIVSYDIADDKLRTRFSKMLTKHGAVRLQFSVYEVRNTKRVVDNIIIKIESFSKLFTMDDSVVIFSVLDSSIVKYGNSIHRDKDVVFL